ncbi:mitochondrial intermediate peptidase-like protein mitochondrial precursor [Lophium mytilinum]|uniref:Mitochondrial intermediate peptidase n=1 Tax=Lophium mytilinum TaxID=390894 RepID=A0A6A6R7B6_9PEZI|nr:mitochondrial intermediate peptidase-like protein mitochondrial precursor [Lophium mytilinum]
MLKRAPSPWTCSRCLSLQRQRRFNSTIATHDLVQPSPLPPSRLQGLGTPGADHDDRTLRKIFDSQAFWKEYSKPVFKPSRKSAGLVNNHYLTRPEGFKHFTENTLSKCERIVEKVVAVNTMEEYKQLPRILDRLSDLLCRVIDLADFVRATHPDRYMQAAASQAYVTMFHYMNRLNTTPQLNEQLKKAEGIPDVYQSWTEPERLVAQILIRDFSKSAIDLPTASRDRFVQLSNEISEVGIEFTENGAPETPYLSFESSKMKGLEPSMARALSKWGQIKIATADTPAQMALRFVEDPDVRREIYMASRTADKPSIRRLEKLLKCRAEIAKLSGFESYGHMTLGEDKMAKSPEAVNQFLNALVKGNHRKVQDELQELIELKKSDARSGNFPGSINAWDKLYYTHQMVSSMHTKLRTQDFFSAYFSLGTVMQGLSRLYNRLYGIRLVPKEPAPGETWNNDVRRLDVISDTDGQIAVLYCDLFSRPGKTPNPAHFTLRCSRELSNAEIVEASETTHPFASPIEAATDGMSYTHNATTNTYFQLPTIALICDFPRPPLSATTSAPTLLTFNDVRTLFHEMGHGLHSFLGRTSFQNVAGTRCATDFAELPSVLNEHFASDPAVLALFARHWETDAPLPLSALEQRIAIDERTQPSETESQILLAMLDQAYHSPLPLAPSFNSTKTYHDIYNAHASVPEPQGTAWQGFFGHLYGYGATYYSYLFDRAIAAKMWSEVFQQTPDGSVSRENGERYKEEVLKWGGGRDGWKCVAGVLRDERLAEGGEEAMKEVGRWGVM